MNRLLVSLVLLLTLYTSLIVSFDASPEYWSCEQNCFDEWAPINNHGKFQVCMMKCLRYLYKK